VLLVFSVAASVLGAAAPFVKAGPGQYTVISAVRKVTEGEKSAAASTAATRGTGTLANRD